MTGPTKSPQAIPNAPAAPLPASHRPLRLRKRPDLEITPQRYGAARYWLVKDPLTLGFFHLKEEEHAILCLLDGTATLTTIQREFERLFPPQRVSLEAVKAFIAELHRNNLVISEAPGQGTRLRERADKQRRRQRTSSLTNLLAIRFRGVDPRPLLRVLEPTFGRLFSPAAYAFAAVVASAALVLCLLKFDVLVARLPRLETFFLGGNLLWLLACLAVVKVLHELGHAMACRRYGGECHEIGLMLLAFLPCLYTDVTDAWKFRDKWRRMAVAAAGIYVEVLIASICAFLWWFSEPGFFNAMCLNLVVVCSVNTLLVNGNPLLRYDGYYLLADFTETPNLWQRSRGLLRWELSRWCLGMPGVSERRFAGSNRWFLLGYAIASMVYRVFVLVMILWFLYSVLAAHGFESLGRLLVMFVAGSLIIPPLVSTAKFLGDPIRRRGVQRRRAIGVAALLAVIALGLLLYPFPYSVTAPATVRLKDATPAYVVVPGHVKTAAKPGAKVGKGNIIAELDDPDVQREIQRLESTRDQQAERVRTLESRRLTSAAAARELPAARATLKDLQARLEQRRRDAKELTIRAAAAGVVFPPPESAALDSPGDPAEKWAGSPLEPHNRGKFLDYGRLVCLIGDPRKLEALLVVSEDDIESVRIGGKVRIQLNSRPGRPIAGEVVDIARGNLRDDPASLFTGGALPHEGQREEADETNSYTMRVRITDSAALLHGETGRARVRAGTRSLATRLFRFVQRTFRSMPTGR